MIIPRSISFSLALMFAACGADEQNGTLCERSFEPYQDLISGQTRTPANAEYVDAMALYSKGEFAAAIEGLEAYLEKRGAAKSAHLYLACCLLAADKPYDAELHIDMLENSNMPDFKDQCEWYTVLCWLCSDQLDRARDGANAIANGGPHTYAVQAKELAAVLTGQAQP